MTARQEFPERARQLSVDAVFTLCQQAKIRVEALADDLRALPLGYDTDDDTLQAIADQLLQIYDEADESIAAVRSIVEAEVMAKFRRPADSDEL